MNENSRAQQVQEAIARFDRLVAADNVGMSPPTIHSEMFQVLLKDNAVLIDEIQALKQEIANLQVQRRLETVRELEAQFPRKGRRRRAVG